MFSFTSIYIHLRQNRLCLWWHTDVFLKWKPIRPSFIFGTQSKIFLIKSESFLTLRRQQSKARWLLGCFWWLQRHCQVFFRVLRVVVGGCKVAMILAVIDSCFSKLHKNIVTASDVKQRLLIFFNLFQKVCELNGNLCTLQHTYTFEISWVMWA